MRRNRREMAAVTPSCRANRDAEVLIQMLDKAGPVAYSFGVGVQHSIQEHFDDRKRETGAVAAATATAKAVQGIRSDSGNAQAHTAAQVTNALQ